MEKKLIKSLREYCEGAKVMTDDEINEVEKDLWTFTAKPFLRVRNAIDLKDLRTAWMIGNWPPGLHITDAEHLWLHDCEKLFVNCLYGPCCVWARATMEHILQIDCLEDPFVSQKLKCEIYSPQTQNPKLGAMKRELKIATSKGSNRWSDEEERICDAIANNGDYVVHHRLDKITRGKTVEDYLREWGVSEEDIKITQVDKQNYIEGNAMTEEQLFITNKKFGKNGSGGIPRLVALRGSEGGQ